MLELKSALHKNTRRFIPPALSWKRKCKWTFKNRSRSVVKPPTHSIQREIFKKSKCACDLDSKIKGRLYGVDREWSWKWRRSDDDGDEFFRRLSDKGFALEIASNWDKTEFGNTSTLTTLYTSPVVLCYCQKSCLREPIEPRQWYVQKCGDFLWMKQLVRTFYEWIIP